MPAPMPPPMPLCAPCPADDADPEDPMRDSAVATPGAEGRTDA